jgi:acyl-coenzyme A synthetase/AMP-(fatty) acid ligase
VKAAGGPIPATVFEIFRDRYGAPPRPAYGTSETGILTAEIGAAAEVRPDRVGRPVPDVRLAIGDSPERSSPPGVPGRVWVATPRHMEGYGFPPDLEPRREQGDWWPTHDLGVVDVAGRLTLLGRLDDAFKTPTGQLVNAAEVTAVVERCPGVAEAIVVAIPGATGSLVGAVVSRETGIDASGIRQHAARHLPAWAQPEVVVLVARLPRLPGGKTDRDACLGLLLDAVAPPGTRPRSS